VLYEVSELCTQQQAVRVERCALRGRALFPRWFTSQCVTEEKRYVLWRPLWECVYGWNDFGAVLVCMCERMALA